MLWKLKRVWQEYFGWMDFSPVHKWTVEVLKCKSNNLIKKNEKKYSWRRVFTGQENEEERELGIVVKNYGCRRSRPRMQVIFFSCMPAGMCCGFSGRELWKISSFHPVFSEIVPRAMIHWYCKLWVHRTWVLANNY